MDHQPFIDENRALWNEWTDVHVAGEFYDRDAFVRDPSDIRLRPEGDERWRMPAGSDAGIPLMFSLRATK